MFQEKRKLSYDNNSSINFNHHSMHNVNINKKANNISLKKENNKMRYGQYQGEEMCDNKN